MSISNPQASNVTRLHTTIMVPFRIANCAPGDEVNLKAMVRHMESPVPGSAHWKAVAAGQRIQNGNADLRLLQEYQARLYFHPFVQQLWADDSIHRLYRREDIASVVYTPAEGGEKIVLDVLSCELALFDPDIAILSIALAATPGLPGFELGRIEQLHDAIRRLYPPYFDRVTANGVTQSSHCPLQIDLCDSAGQCLVSGNFDHRGKHISALASNPNTPDTDGVILPLADHWRFLIRPFAALPYEANRYWAVQLGDDRAPLLSHLAFPDPADLSVGDMVRLCFADERGDKSTLPNSASFLGDFVPRYCYDRWWEPQNRAGPMTTRTMNCGYAFVMVGKDNESFTNEDSGILFTFRHLYTALGLLAHFQKASLLAALWRISRLSHIDPDTGEPGDIDAEQVRHFYQHFLKFTHRFWFDEVSPQEQGREIFAMWRKELRIQELYDEVRQELQDLLQYVDTCEARIQAVQATKLTKVATMLGSFGLAVGFLGMNFFEGKDGQLSFFGWTWKAGIAPASNPLLWNDPIAWYSVGIIASAGMLAYACARSFMKMKKNGTRTRFGRR